jgi:MoaA/NifB/PqqE/SkfB family radical SAM enzyme
MDHDKTPLPTFLQVEPVGQCNLRCQMCPIQFRQDGPPHGPPAFMEFALFTRLLDQLPQLEQLHLQGLGEPMMHPRFFDMIQFATRRGIKVTTNTNLTLLNAKRADQCISSGLAELHASLDGATAETFERIRVRAKFNRVVDNLRGLVAARTRQGSPTPAIRLVMVLMRQNLRELPEVVRLAHACGVQIIFVQHLCHDFAEESLPQQYRPMREFVDEQMLLDTDGELITHYFDEARRVAGELGVNLRLPCLQRKSHPAGTPGPERCDWPWKGAYASFQGLAMPCCMVATPDRIQMGNLAAVPLREVWDGASYRSFRAALSSETPPSVCSTCSVYRGVF